MRRGVNHDGSNKIGYTAPSVHGQAEVVAEAMAIAGFDARTIGYVEAHGTATPLGDPVEIAALTKAYRTSTDAKQFCAIGSVKANIGHCMSAAGVAGLIKATLALHHRTLPPAINFDSPNPEIDFASSPFFVNTKLSEWKSDGPRRAGVSAFGLGGTNAHVVLEEAPTPAAEGPARRKHHILALSAKTETALDKATENLVRYLAAHGDSNLGDISFTLLLGRAAFEHRRVVVTQSAGELVALVRDLDRKRTFTANAVDRPVAFLLPGAVADRMAGTATLYDNEPVFREHVDRCASGLALHLGGDIRTVLYPGRGGQEGDAAALARAAPFVVGMAMSKLLLDWGVTPRALVAWGAGEYAAACIAGVMSLDDAIAALAAALKQKPGGTASDGRSGPLAHAQLNPPSMPIVEASGEVLEPSNATDRNHWAGALIDRVPATPPWAKLSGGQNWVVLALGVAEEASGASTLLPCVGSGDGQQGDAALLLESVAQFWALGGAVDWQRFFAGETHRRLALPGYPFERVRCWIDPPAASARGATSATAVAALATDAGAATGGPADANEIEREVAMMWKEVLGVVPTGRQDDFLKLGGDSLMVSRLVARVREKYEIDVSMESFLQATTLDAMAAVVTAELVKGVSEEDLAALLNAEESEGGTEPESQEAPSSSAAAAVALVEGGREPSADPVISAWMARQSPGSPSPKSWDEVVQRGAVVAGDGIGRFELDTSQIAAQRQSLGQFALRVVLTVLRQLGAFHAPTTTPAKLIADCHVVPSFHKLIRWWLLEAADHGHLVREGETFRVAGPHGSGQPSLGDTSTEHFTLAEFEQICGATSGIVTGREHVLDFLFGAKRQPWLTQFSEQSYRDETVSRYLNSVASHMLTAAAKGHTEQRPLRVLEVGAGFGALTKAVLETLGSTPYDYVFTDVSMHFVRTAAASIKASGPICFGRLDINDDPRTLGFKLGMFDVVIGYDVLHCAKQLQRTLEYMHWYLRPGGLLMAEELLTNEPPTCCSPDWCPATPTSRMIA